MHQLYIGVHFLDGGNTWTQTEIYTYVVDIDTFRSLKTRYLNSVVTYNIPLIPWCHQVRKRGKEVVSLLDKGVQPVSRTLQEIS